MTEKRYTYLNYSRDGYIGSFYENDKPLTNKEVCDILKEQKEEIQELKQRNQRQYERLKELEDLILKKDWKTLEQIADEWEKQEKLLNQEWGTYCENK